MSQPSIDAPAYPGLLFAMRFDEAGRGRPIPGGEPIPDPGAFGEGFLWLHFDLVDARFEQSIAEGRLGPPALATSAFGPDEHQRITVEAGFLGGVVADLCPQTRSPTPPDGPPRLHFVLGPRFLVSGRRRPVTTPDAARDAVAGGAGIASPIQLLESMVSHVVAAIAAGGTRLNDELDLIEDHILDAKTRVERRRLGPIRRDAVRLHRQLLGLRSVFHRLEEDGGTVGMPAAEVATAGRLAQRLDALDRDMMVLAERSRLLQEELSTRLAEQANRQLHTLSILTALFLPPTLVTGIFGMNTKNLPLADVESGSLVALAIALASALIAYGIIRLLGIRAPKA